MASELARYIFLPFFRQGIAQYIEIDDKPDQDLQQKRVALQIKLKVEQKTELIPQNIELYGPGDVIGLDPRHIVRTDPTFKTVVSDYEPNFMPLIEFSRIDLPWCMTPAKPWEDTPNRLSPWICLIVLKAKDGEDIIGEYEDSPMSSDQPSPAIKVNKQNSRLPLPNLTCSWALAHVQVTTEKQAITDNDEEKFTPDVLRSIMMHSPEKIVSRLICPRKLEPGVLYHAFVVPTYESGRLAGLGQEIPVNTPILKPAWTKNLDSVVLPYYFKWEFRTGLKGDFEYLVRLLEPRIIDPRVGIRHFDCKQPGYGFKDDQIVSVESLPDGDELKHSLGLEGALRSLQTESTDWPKQTTNIFQLKLRDLLNLPNTYTDQNSDESNETLLGPPLYGKWQASRLEVSTELSNSDDPDDRDWFNMLNLDPRHRVTSGFGTIVIQDQQEQLMASAWDQVGTILEANQRLRQAQMACKVSSKIHKDQLQQLSMSGIINLTSKLHSRVLIETVIEEEIQKLTVQNLIKFNSSIPISVLTPAFRRIQRPRGPFHCTQLQDSDPLRKDLIERLNNAEIAPAGEPPKPNGLFTIDDISKGLRPNGARFIELFGSKLRWLLLFIITLLGLLLIFLFWLYRFFGGINLLIPLLPYLAIIIGILILFLRFILPLYYFTNVSNEVVAENTTADAIKNANIEPEFQFEIPPFVYKPPEEPNPLVDLDIEMFREYAIQAHEKFLDKGFEKMPTLEPLNLEEIKSTILSSLNPHETILARTRMQFRRKDLVDEDMNPIKVAPEFPQPMYEPLRDLSQEYLLPGLEFIPQNTLGLLETNRKFIESYMVGLNAEMAREFKWREYPSPLDATYFRQFWDVSEFFPPAKMRDEIEQEIEEKKPQLEENLGRPLTTSEIEIEIDKLLKEKLKDINHIHLWRDNELGENPNPKNEEDHVDEIDDEEDDNEKKEDTEEVRKLVLLVRGDLLKKYPTALIYAVEGDWVEPEVGDYYICTSSDGRKWNRTPIFTFTEDQTKYPIFKGTLPPDITFLGFDLTEEKARGHTEIGNPDDPDKRNHPGWYFVIEERIGETRFGIDEQINELPEGAVLDNWDSLTWEYLTREAEWNQNSNYINGVNPDPALALDPPWDSHSANRAEITLQKPVRIAVHADDMIPKEE